MNDVITTEPVFTFWEGKKPAYIELCMKTWKVNYIELNYDNLRQFTDLSVDKLRRFTLPQQADCIRVHVLRDQGGYWLDADTIMRYAALPTENMIGYPETRANTIGYLHTKPYEPMYLLWSKYQDNMLENAKTPAKWDVMGNAFTDEYVKKNKDITIASVKKSWPETYMMNGVSRWDKYRRFWFEKDYHLDDLELAPLLMLHNSWTPSWYKELREQEVLSYKCTLSNVLKEMLL